MDARPDGSVTLTLNTASGVLHASRRCAGRDTRFHYHVWLGPGDQLLGFIYLKFTGLCRRETWAS